MQWDLTASKYMKLCARSFSQFSTMCESFCGYLVYISSFLLGVFVHLSSTSLAQLRNMICDFMSSCVCFSKINKWKKSLVMARRRDSAIQCK